MVVLQRGRDSTGGIRGVGGQGYIGREEELDERTWRLSSARREAAHSDERSCKGGTRPAVTKTDSSNDASVHFRGREDVRSCRAMQNRNDYLSSAFA